MKIYINTDTKKNNIAKYPSHSLCCLYYLLPYSNYTLLFLTFLKKKNIVISYLRLPYCVERIMNNEPCHIGS